MCYNTFSTEQENVHLSYTPTLTFSLFSKALSTSTLHWAKHWAPVHFSSGLSQMQFQKSLEQYPKIPKSVVVQHKIGVRMINVKNRTKYHLQNKLK